MLMILSSIFLHGSVTGQRGSPWKNRDLGPSAGKLLFLINKRPTGKNKTIFKNGTPQTAMQCWCPERTKPNVIGQQEHSEKYKYVSVSNLARQRDGSEVHL